MDLINGNNKKNGSLNGNRNSGIGLDVQNTSQTLMVNSYMEEKLDAVNAFSFISRPTKNHLNLLDKIKAISNLMLNRRVFNFLINYALRNDKMQKNMKIGSEVLNDFRYTSIITNYDDIENYAIYATVKSNGQINKNLPGTITSFMLRKDKALINLWLNKIEIRIIGMNGEERKMKFSYSTVN